MLQNKVEKVFHKNNGTISLRFAKAEGLDKETLRKAYLRGDLERPYRGIYSLPDRVEDDLWAIQELYPKGIYSHESALYLHRLTTFAPFRYYMTFPRGFSSRSFKQDYVVPSWVLDKYWDVGLSEGETLVGNRVRVFDLERTMLDVLSSNRIQPNLLTEAAEEYLSRSDANPDRLYEYGKLMKRPQALERWEELLVK